MLNPIVVLRSKSRIWKYTVRKNIVSLKCMLGFHNFKTEPNTYTDKSYIVKCINCTKRKHKCILISSKYPTHNTDPNRTKKYKRSNLELLKITGMVKEYILMSGKQSQKAKFIYNKLEEIELSYISEISIQ